MNFQDWVAIGRLTATKRFFKKISGTASRPVKWEASKQASKHARRKNSPIPQKQLHEMTRSKAR